MGGINTVIADLCRRILVDCAAVKKYITAEFAGADLPPPVFLGNPQYAAA